MAKTQNTAVAAGTTPAPAPVINNANQENGKPVNEQPKTDEPPAPAPVTVVEPTSERLAEIHAKIPEAFKRMDAETDLTKKLVIVGEIQKLQSDEKAELAAIKAAALQAEINEKRNAQIKIGQDAIEAAIAADKSAWNDKISLEDKQKLSDVAKVAWDKLATVLVSKFPNSSTAKPSSGSTAPVSGTKSEMIERMMKNGNTYDEILAAGAGDGTIRTVAGNIKFKKNADGTYSPRA